MQTSQNPDDSSSDIRPPTPRPADHFGIIKAARAMMGARPASSASEASRAKYQAEALRLFDRRNEHDGDIWKAAANTTSVATWFKRRASIQSLAWAQIEEILKRQDQIQRSLRGVPESDPRWKEWRTMVSGLHFWTDTLQRMPTGAPLNERKRRTSKRRLGAVPADWREQLAQRLPRWHLPFLVAAVSGCRPAELAVGVDVAVAGGELKVRIKGVKVRPGAGQPWRELFWPLDGDGASPLVRRLADHAAASGGAMVVDLGQDNSSPARAFSDAIRAAAARAWPTLRTSITAYSLRHAAASDAKASGLSPEDISAALGHAVEHTQGTYGHGSQSRGGSVAPAKVVAARAVKPDVAPDRRWGQGQARGPRPT